MKPDYAKSTICVDAKGVALPHRPRRRREKSLADSQYCHSNPCPRDAKLIESFDEQRGSLWISHIGGIRVAALDGIF